VDIYVDCIIIIIIMTSSRYNNLFKLYNFKKQIIFIITIFFNNFDFNEKELITDIKIQLVVFNFVK